MPYKFYWLGALCAQSLLLLTMEERPTSSDDPTKLFLSQLFLSTIRKQELVEFDDRSEIRVENPQEVIQYSGDPVEDLQEILGTNLMELRTSNALIPKIVKPPATVPSLSTVSDESNMNPLDELFSEPDPLASVAFGPILEEQFLINSATQEADQIALKESVSHYGQLNLNLDNELSRYSNKELKQIKNKIVAKLRQPEMHVKKDADPLKNELIALLDEISKRIKCHTQLRGETGSPKSKKKKTEMNGPSIKNLPCYPEDD
ncbi:hypothetical protein HYX58_02580 [Candidatus Dependentiae bacterium]|nr:hypothetical protein [Candidatus Dependentiae bacterium]